VSTIYLIDHYANNLSSHMHKASTLSKLISTTLALGITMFTSSSLALMIDFLLILMFMAIAELPVFRMLQWALYPAFFASLFALSQLPYSFILPIITMFKAVNTALIMLFLVSTTPYPELFSVISIPSQTIGNVAFLTYRFFFMFIDQTSKRFTAMKARGGLAGDWRKRVDNLANFVGLIFVISFEISENVYSAMKTRGYSGKIFCHRKMGRRFSKNDLMPAAFALCFSTLMVISLFIREGGVLI
jgi:cobalt/nickel transport system permease protein